MPLANSFSGAYLKKSKMELMMQNVFLHQEVLKGRNIAKKIKVVSQKYCEKTIDFCSFSPSFPDLSNECKLGLAHILLCVRTSNYTAK